MAEPLSPSEQGLGVPEPKRPCFPTLGIRQADGAKALSKQRMILDQLSAICGCTLGASSMPYTLL
jgi:hypothetical protein